MYFSFLYSRVPLSVTLLYKNWDTKKFHQATLTRNIRNIIPSHHLSPNCINSRDTLSNFHLHQRTPNRSSSNHPILTDLSKISPLKKKRKKEKTLFPFLRETERETGNVISRGWNYSGKSNKQATEREARACVKEARHTDEGTGRISTKKGNAERDTKRAIVH